jgi:hypothetical protein
VVGRGRRWWSFEGKEGAHLNGAPEPRAAAAPGPRALTESGPVTFFICSATSAVHARSDKPRTP